MRALPLSRQLLLRLTLGLGVLAMAGLAGSAVIVSAGEAVMVTAFGAPQRVLTQPGLAWKLPAPLEAALPVDLRLRTSSTGAQDVGTRDGLRVIVQAYVAWQVPAEPAAITRFVRAVRNDPDEAARQLRGFAASALQVASSGFELADLVNTDPTRLRLAEFERRLAEQLAAPALESYGIAVRQVGLEGLSLPQASLAATVARMRSERETAAAERTAEGLRAAAEVRYEAEREARVTVARARTEAAGIEADAQREVAAVQGRAWRADPGLYTTLRKLDTLGQLVGSNTRLVLRTDAAPFTLLVAEPPR